MGIVALDTVHLSFQHRMFVREVKFGTGRQVAFQAGLGVLAWVGDELPFPAAGRDMEAAGTMAGFASVQISFFSGRHLDLSVSTHGEGPGNVGMAVIASLVADKGGT